MGNGGRIFAAGRCWGCGTLFTFDAERVPSVEVDPQTNMPADLAEDVEDALARAVRQPICSICVERANAIRARLDRPLIVVPLGAYPFTDDL